MNKNFHNLVLGVSVLPALLVMPAVAEYVPQNSYTVQDNKITVTSGGQTFDGVSFTNLSTSGDDCGAAMSIKYSGTDDKGLTTIRNSLYSGNSAVADAEADSGAFNVVRGDVRVENTKFLNNEAKTGGAIYTYLPKPVDYFSKLVINNSVFQGNIASGEDNDDVENGGGAIVNVARNYRNNGDAGLWISNSQFIGNKNTKNNLNGGGAINAGSESRTNIVNTEFIGNTSASRGGAISGRNFDKGENSKAIMDIIGSVFKGNTAVTTGGAIDNTFYDSDTRDGSVYIADTTFGGMGEEDGNSAMYGGAIYNHISQPGDTHQNQVGNLYVTGSSFFGNKATKNGGAIYNEATLVFNGTNTFRNNKANGVYTPNSQNTSATYVDGKGGSIYNSGDLTVSGTFENNSAFHGGAIYNKGTLTVSGGSLFDGNYANVEGGAIANYGNLNILNNVVFNNNKAFIKDGDLDVLSGGSEMGAAIYSEGTGATRTVNIGDNVKFTNNYSPFGNLYFLNANDVTIGNNVEFSGNSSQKAAGIRTSSTGAGNSTITIGDNAKFVNNTVTSATGAAAIRLYDDNVTIGKNAIFSDNIGTAIYNGNSNITVGSNVTFSGNNANAAEGIGGALINHGVAVATFDSGLFTNNTATLAGGAIYNKENAIVNFGGDVVFSGNKANGVANDIHNLGTVNIISGTTTIDGGISGTGTLTVADGAILNIGTAAVKQNSMALDGTLNATLLNTNKFASVDAANFASQEGAMNLTLKGVGDYKVFKHAVFNNSKISYTYDATLFSAPVWNEGKDTITVSMKPVEEIAANTGIKSETAAAVSHIAEAASKSESALLQDLSLKVQEKLASGDTEAVEQVSKAINPEKESVAQSVSTSVQNTVVSLASARMSAPSVGRNGGDIELTKGGVWAQGLFNKSKQNDAFNGYTRGIALGMDGTINKDWTIGAGYSFAHSDISGTARDTKIDSNTVFVYGQYKPAEWYVNAIMNYTMSDYSERGTILDGIAVTGDYKVNSFGGALATGYDFDNGITPELGLRYMHVSANDYANSYGIKTHMDDSNFLTGVIGAKYAFNVVANDHLTFAPQLNAGLKYDLVSDKNVATVTMPGLNAYTLEGNRLNRIGGEFGIGLGMQYHEMELSVNYDIDVRKDYTSQTGMLKFRYNF